MDAIRDGWCVVERSGFQEIGMERGGAIVRAQKIILFFERC
jgi:hypothetical protein